MCVCVCLALCAFSLIVLTSMSVNRKHLHLFSLHDIDIFQMDLPICVCTVLPHRIATKPIHECVFVHKEIVRKACHQFFIIAKQNDDSRTHNIV